MTVARATILPVEVAVGEARYFIDLSMSEAAWQQQACDYAAAEGWRFWHDTDSRKNDPSYPDLTLWRERLVFLELKAMRGALSVDRLVRDRRGMHFRKGQATTILELIAAGCEVYVARPCDFARLTTVLRRGGAPLVDWREETRREAETAMAKAMRRHAVGR